MGRYILCFNFQDRVWDYVLPAQNNRKLQLDLGRELRLNHCTLHVEVWEKQWHIRSNEQIGIFMEKQWKEDIAIKTGDIITGKIYAHGISFSILVMELDSSRIDFQKFSISGKEKLTLGSGRNCDICIDNPYISNLHAIFQMNDSHMVLVDKSTNGIYINGQRMHGESNLHLFDEIDIVGTKIIVLQDVLAINKREILHTNLPVATSPEYKTRENVVDSGPFSRSPRVMEPVQADDVEIEAPPAPQRSRQQPLIFILGPAFTMPLPILASVLFNITYRAQSSSPVLYFGSMVAVLTSALIGVGWALARHFYGKHTAKQDEEQRRRAYKEYIEDNQNLLEQNHQKVDNILNGQYKDTRTLAEHIRRDPMLLWNRNINHGDFLTVRLGKGMIAFPGNISIPKQRFSIYKDSLAEQPQKLFENYRYIQNTVACLSLKKEKLIGMLGNEDRMWGILRNIILQAALLHSYTDLKIAVLYDESQDKELSWVRWLPHTFSVGRKHRMIGNTSLTRQNVLYYLGEDLRARANALAEKNPVFLPHFLVICTSPEQLETENLYSYITNDEQYGFTFLLAYGQIDQLPNTCKAILECGERFEGYYHLHESRKPTDQLHLETISVAEADHIARKISGVYVRESALGEIPDQVDFLELYGISKVEQWDLIQHWRENRTYESLRALIGISSGGKPMYLDIHEKKHGPHGLMAGTTGSGKSATLQTYILSLAMNYSPNELAFILIDYKGGGMANAFEGLIHLAGVITNLEGGRTRRALLSIRSEKERRQQLFNKYHIENIDQYIRLYREGKTPEPLPHLLIISDEFAELKKEQPEFIHELVSIARTGRSLGIHLILATQKPSGVISDEIWSNARFKLCLRVQDRQDSNEVLHRPDAVYLTNAGRGFLQIGNDELFEMFQAGYAGTEYFPSDTLYSAKDQEVSMIDMDGTKQVAREVVEVKQSDSVSQLSAVVSYIIDQAKKYKIIKTRQLWLPELPEELILQNLPNYTALNAGEELKAIFGLIDDPVHQQQRLATLNFSRIANLLIVGLPGCGKSTLLQTLLFDLSSHFSPEELCFYCMDFSGGLLRTFAFAPNCGGVVLPEDEEGVRNLLSMVSITMEKRSTIFRKENIGSYSEYKSVSMEKMPTILLVLDNFAAFSELYEEQQEELFKIARDGLKYGVHLIVTLNYTNEMRFKYRQNFTNTLSLSMAERSDYMDVLKKMPDFTPIQCRGRGLLLEEDTIVEYQVALPAAGKNEKERGDFIRQELSRKWESCAPRIPQIDKNETYLSFCAHAPSTHIPVGYDKDTLEVVGFNVQSSFCIAVNQAENEGKERFLGNLADYAQYSGKKLYLVHLDSRTNIFANNHPDLLATDEEGIYLMLSQLREEFKKRSDCRKEFLTTHGDQEWGEYLEQHFTPIFILIDDMVCFSEIIYGGKPVDLSAVTEVLMKKGQGFGIYFVAFFSSESEQKTIYTTMAKTFISYQTGIRFGGHLDQQRILPVSLSWKEQTKTMQQGYAYMVADGKARIVYMPKRTVEDIEKLKGGDAIG